MSEEDNRKWSMWHIRVPKHLDTKLEKYIEQDSFATKAEFVRGAVRDRLETEKEKLGETIGSKPQNAND